MKKFGFTLAEVLITLSIIGVIAAVTLPSLNTSTSLASIGPKLGKAVSVFEQANQALLSEETVDALSDTEVFSAGNTATYLYGNGGNSLSNHLKISDGVLPDGGYDTTGAGATCQTEGALLAGTVALSKDGMLYIVNITNFNAVANNPHMNVIGSVFIDINGTARPNEVGSDLFAFNMYNDGSLRAIGARSLGGNFEGGCNWRNVCPLTENGATTDLWACSGHVFENNMVANYR